MGTTVKFTIDKYSNAVCSIHVHAKVLNAHKFYIMAKKSEVKHCGLSTFKLCKVRPVLMTAVIQTIVITVPLY